MHGTLDQASRGRATGQLDMQGHPRHPISAEDAIQGHFEGVPGTPRRSGFVPIHLITGAVAHVLALALHRDSEGIQRPGHSSRLLADAIGAGEIECDPIAVSWIPPMPAAEVAMVSAWGTRTGYEGARHRHLRAAATGLLAALAPGMEIQAERPRHRNGRCVRPDLQVSFGPNGVLLAEVGVVEGDAIAALLLPERQICVARAAALVTHVIVLPFAGQRTDAARGYVFQRTGQSKIRAPKRSAIRAAWKNFAERSIPRSRRA
jgi:hypothetical protein